MKILLLSLITLAVTPFSYAGPLRLQKRAAFYIANETACVVDNIVYSNGDPIPTDDPCESCKCRPPGFACVLKDCEIKPGCRAVRKVGHCCPDYICGCEHNGRMYRDGEEIRDSKNPCYQCHCTGSSIACAFVDCFFRVDCAPEYEEGECCPHFNNCNGSTVNEARQKETIPDTATASDSTITPGVSYVSETTQVPNTETTVIEIFESETKQPDEPESEPSVNLYAIKAEEPSESKVSSESTEEVEEHNEPKSEIPLSPTVSEEPTEMFAEERNPDSNLDGKEELEVETTTQQEADEHSSTENKSEISVFTPKEDVEQSDKTLTKLEEFNSPKVVENVNVEPEEPSNTLELIDLPSDYGKSLRFPEKDIASNDSITQPQETPGTWKSILEEASTDPPISPEIPTVSAISEESSLLVTEKEEEPATDTALADANLYYNVDKAPQTGSVQKVTTLIEVKEPMQSPKVDTTEVPSPSSSSVEENLFKSLIDKLKEEDKEKVITVPESLYTTLRPDENSSASVADEKTEIPASDKSATVKNEGDSNNETSTSQILTDATSND